MARLASANGFTSHHFFGLNFIQTNPGRKTIKNIEDYPPMFINKLSESTAQPQEVLLMHDPN